MPVVDTIRTVYPNAESVNDAIRFEWGRAYFLVTDAEGEMPQWPDQPITVGAYDREDNACLDGARCNNLEQAMEWLDYYTGHINFCESIRKGQENA